MEQSLLFPPTHFSHMSHTPFSHISECNSFFGAESFISRHPFLPYVAHPFSPYPRIQFDIFLFEQLMLEDLQKTVTVRKGLQGILVVQLLMLALNVLLAVRGVKIWQLISRLQVTKEILHTPLLPNYAPHPTR